MPWRRRIAHTFAGASLTPMVASSPWIRRYPHIGFSFAGEGSLRPCPLGSTVVQAGAASRSTSLAPDLDAIAKVSGWTRNRPRRAGDRSRLSPARTALSTGRSAGRATCLRKTATSWRSMTTSMARSCCSPHEKPNQLERTDESDVEEGECHAPSSSSVSRQQKSRPMGPDDVFGMHTLSLFLRAVWSPKQMSKQL
jgi:hypothetical protein